MQYTKHKIKAQQMLLFHLGHYTGIIDGIWGPDSIQAKQKFERDVTFLPAYPTGGMPFGDRDRLPKGCNYNVDGTLTHETLTAERASEIEKAMEARTSTRGSTKDLQPVDESPFVKPEAPVVEEPILQDSDAEEAVEDSSEPNEGVKDAKHSTAPPYSKERHRKR